MLCNGVGHRIPLGGRWALSLTFHRWRNLNTKGVSDFFREGRKQLCEGMGVEKRKKIFPNPFLPGRVWRKQTSLKVNILLEYFSSGQVGKFRSSNPTLSTIYMHLSRNQHILKFGRDIREHLSQSVYYTDEGTKARRLSDFIKLYDV